MRSATSMFARTSDATLRFDIRIGFTETDVNQNSRVNIDEFRAWWLSG